ncbi:cell wall protein [Streptomyces sp. NPDC015220]|uniref:cell wall protein n=1 Tax=Streptomyces sp. NPDC015220 TaxID=3364947 RepID=UPI0036FD94F1
MSSARRTLLTATAAGTLLGALWFVPSASATGGAPARETADAASAARVTQPVQGRAAATSMAGYRAASADQAGTRAAGSRVGAQAGSVSAEDTQLADTGSPDTTPYVVGGTLFLALGAGFVVYSVRRERLGF